jgi:hypothetical protein
MGVDVPIDAWEAKPATPVAAGDIGLDLIEWSRGAPAAVGVGSLPRYKS